jgi:hypothetical protein
MTHLVVSEDPMMTHFIISDDLITTHLLSVKELTDDSDDPTDDNSRHAYFGHD